MQEKKKSSLAPHRIWLMLGGGAMSGAYGAGVVMALVDAGFGEVFDGVIGVSTGAPTLGYFLAARPSNPPGKNLYQTTVYSEEACSRGFFRPGLRLNVAWLTDVFRGSTGKPIEWERVQEHPSRYVIVVTDWETGIPRYIEPENRDDMFMAIHGACSIPLMAPPVRLRGDLVTDSSVSEPMPIEWLMRLSESTRPTHVLVIANTWREPPSVKKQQLERLLVSGALRHRAPRTIRSNMHKRFTRFHEAVQASLGRTDVVVGVDWLPWPAKSLDRNATRLRRLTEVGYDRWLILTKKPREP